MISPFIGRVFFLVLALLQLSSIPPSSAQLFKLKTSYSALTANMVAYWLAKETRLFEKHGLDVDVVLIESGTTTIQALVAGETQIAMGGGTVAVSSALAAISPGRPLSTSPAPSVANAIDRRCGERRCAATRNPPSARARIPGVGALVAATPRPHSARPHQSPTVASSRHSPSTAILL